MKAIWLLLLGFGCFPLVALTVSRESLHRQLDSAVLVADVQILSRRVSVDPQVAYLTQPRASVLNVVSIRDDGGEFPQKGDEISLATPGGEKDGVGMLLTGY